MDNVIDRILDSRVAKGIEEAKRKIAARVHRKTNFVHRIGRIGAGLRSADGASLAAAANVELIVIVGKRLQMLCLHLDRVVDIGRGIHGARVHDVCEIFVRRYLVLHAHGSVRDRDVRTAGVIYGYRVE